MMEWFSMLAQLRYLLVAAALLFGPWPLPADGAGVRLNEILADPASDWDGDGIVQFRDDEWVEIMNTGADPVDASEYWLKDADDSAWRYCFSGSLEAGETRVVWGSEAVAWQRVTGQPLAGLSLNNAGDTVRLYRVTGMDTVLVDLFEYPGHVGVDNRSAGRLPNGTGPWILFDALEPYGGGQDPVGTGCLPTPGYLNDCTAADRSESWGKIKALFGTE